MHGRSSWVWSALWGPLAGAAKSGTTEKVKVTSDYDSRPGIIHVDDVVDGVHKATDHVQGLLGDWPIFDLVGEHVLIRDVMEGAKKVLGVKGSLEFVGTQGNPFFEALGLVNNNQSSRANIVLGWEAKHRNFLLNLETYVRAWVAAQEEQK